MKIKQVILKIFVGLFIIFATKELIGGFIFSKALSFTLFFISLFLLTEWLTTRIRIFFMLPNILPLLIILHTALIVGLLYLGNEVIAGITITKLHPGVYPLLGKSTFLKSLGEFGTIGVVSLFMGTAYQLINWLNNEK